MTRFLYSRVVLRVVENQSLTSAYKDG